jgi:hypothetical protein
MTQVIIANRVNCWKIPLGQSAAKPAREGSTTIRKEYTCSQVEAHDIPLG